MSPKLKNLRLDWHGRGKYQQFRKTNRKRRLKRKTKFFVNTFGALQYYKRNNIFKPVEAGTGVSGVEKKDDLLRKKNEKLMKKKIYLTSANVRSSSSLSVCRADSWEGGEGPALGVGNVRAETGRYSRALPNPSLDIRDSVSTFTTTFGYMFIVGGSRWGFWW
ncbi:hypothetical protein BpHYR1_021320 [Brachionus plicatilis]|uniref:Uncharacterized protein n=1 Tax=Brachionus plicatilis TaxID=10195 RepID=A0A3M7T6P0_BRAPC|nr:hypothetical protein BpHYR1_021320 [Brachionus plicatilis]